jgi:hypothetical protein
MFIYVYCGSERLTSGEAATLDTNLIKRLIDAFECSDKLSIESKYYQDEYRINNVHQSTIDRNATMSIEFKVMAIVM